MPVRAADPSPIPAGSRTIRMAAATAFEDEKRPDPEAVAAFQEALKREKKIRQELDSIRRASYAAGDVTSYASYAASALKDAEQKRARRSDAISSLPERNRAALESRKSALAAIDDYRKSADDALKAISAYARANGKQAKIKARLADAALDKKAGKKRDAESAVAASEAAAREYLALLEQIQHYDHEVQRLLSEARRYGADIKARCNSLEETVKADKPDLVAAVEAALAEVRPKVEQFVSDAAEAGSLESEAYRPLMDGLKKSVNEDPSMTDAIEAYFETSVFASVKNESYAFLVAAQMLAAPDKRARAEEREASLSVKAAAAETAAARTRIVAGINSSQNAQFALAERISKLPRDAEVIAGLIQESSSMVAGLDPVVKQINQAVEKKKQEYAAARQSADKAYLLAYGRRRNGVLAKSEWEPVPAPRPVMEPTIQVTEHVLARVDALYGEPQGYGAYTYVLFRHTYATAQSHIKQRYDALLEALYRSTSPVEKFTAPIPPERLNIFCIPFRKYVRDGKRFEEYDSDLARSYLATAGSGAILRRDVVSQVRNSPGPFLLTTRTRLSEGSSKTQLLFVDLSRYPAEAFDSILAAYKNTVVEHPPAGQEVWTPPVTKRVVYAGISVSGAIPGLMNSIKKLVDFFVPSAHAGEK